MAPVPRIRLQVQSRATAPWVVFGNALGTDTRIWSNQLAALAPHCSTAVFDYPGHGRAADQGYDSIEQLAQALLAALDGQGVSRFLYCGVSMGGALGLTLSLLAPERLTGLLLSNTAAHFAPAAGWTARMDQAREHGVASLASAAVDRWLRPDHATADTTLAAWLQQMFSATSLHGYAHACAALRDFDARALLGTITTPACIVSGEHDVATPTGLALQLHQGIGGSRHVRLPAAHLANVDQAGDFNELLISLLSQTTWK